MNSSSRKLIAEIHYPLVTTDQASHGRHLRQVENVWCTPDGHYAIILCSDNAVLIYSLMSDPFEYNQGPESCIASKGCLIEDSWKGFISIWFQATDLYKLHFRLSYKCNTTYMSHDIVPTDDMLSSSTRPQPSLCDVMIAIAWQPSWKNPDQDCTCLVNSLLLLLLFLYNIICICRWCDEI